MATLIFTCIVNAANGKTAKNKIITYVQWKKQFGGQYSGLLSTIGNSNKQVNSAERYWKSFHGFMWFVFPHYIRASKILGNLYFNSNSYIIEKFHFSYLQELNSIIITYPYLAACNESMLLALILVLPTVIIFQGAWTFKKWISLALVYLHSC